MSARIRRRSPDEVGLDAHRYSEQVDKPRHGGCPASVHAQDKYPRLIHPSQVVVVFSALGWVVVMRPRRC